MPEFRHRATTREPAITATTAPFRARRAVLAAALALTALPLLSARAGAPTGDDLAACATPGQVQIRDDTWARIRSPQYAANEGDRKVTAFAIPPTQRRWVFVTNGSVVQLSTSAGCTWHHIYPAPSQTDAVAATPRTRVVTHLAAPAPNMLWIASYDDAGGTARPHVERTVDATPAAGNKTEAAFQSWDNGLPAVGRPVQLAVSPANGEQAYLVLDTTPDAGNGSTDARRQVFRSTVDLTLRDAGLPSRTWAELTLPAEVATPDGLAVSPADSSVLWAWQGSSYAVSTDGGDTWRTGRAGGPVTAVDVDNTGRAAVFARSGEEATQTFLDDTLAVTGVRPVPVVPVRAAHAQRYDVHAVAGTDGTYGWDVNHERWVPIHPRGVAPFEALAFGSSSTGRILLGQSGGDLYRLDLFPGEAFIRPPKSLGGNDIRVNEAGSIATPTLRVQRRVVTVAPSRTVPDRVDFGLPPSPVPLDVFFLMDTTDSMGNAIDGLKRGVKEIARNLTARTNGSACFGVGDIKDEQLANSQGASLVPYRLVQPITCDLDELQRGVDELKEGGGNADQREAQTIALTQAVTGKGQAEPPTVLPEQDAHFTAPTRVIVLITDAGFMQGSAGGYTFPTIQDTVRTLNAYHDTKVVGVVVHTENDFPKALADVTAVVSGTHTVAPEWGVDCDGIGGPDVGPGEPLVCETENTAPAIEPAIVALLLNVKDPGTMASRVVDPHHVVARVDGTLSRVVDLKRENHQPYTLHLTCAPEQDGQDLPLRLYGSVRGETVVTDEVVVRCRAPLTVPRVPLPSIAEPPLPEPAPPLRPIAPILLVEPQPVVNNPPNNLNMNAGLSHEEEQQFQLAAVGQEASETDAEEADELAMSALPPAEDRAAAWLLLGAATAVSGGAAAVWARRWRTATAPAAVRR